MRQHLPTAVAAALILLGGTVHGYRTDRWGLSPELQQAVDSLPKLPLNVGDWQGEDVELVEDQQQQFENAECHARLLRRYIHRWTGEVVNLMVVCGPTGPIATHDPRACYGGGGWEMAGPPARREFPVGPDAGAGGAAFWAGDFRRTDSASPMGLMIYWSFRGGRAWEAADDPRVDFAARRALYKIYVIREVAVPDGAEVVDTVSPRFIQALLPDLERAVFSGTALRPGGDGTTRQ